MEQIKLNHPRTWELLERSNEFYEDLLGYKPEQTSLQVIPKNEWGIFLYKRGLSPNYSGIYLPRNQTSIVKEDNPLSLFHEYFGHGLYCEQSLQGRKIVDLEKKLLEEEKSFFTNKRFTKKDLEKFREGNPLFKNLMSLKEQNIREYEFFAIWTEYLLSKEFGVQYLFEEKYSQMADRDKTEIEDIIDFSKKYGDLSTFYSFGLARRTTTERVKRLLMDIYGEENIYNSKLILLTGSKRPFSDIDIFASSNYLSHIKNQWLDLVTFKEKDFERRVNLFDIQIVLPIMEGELIAGSKEYLEEKREQLLKQPITEDAINYNFIKSNENKTLSMAYPRKSEERRIGLSYAKSYLINSLALKKNKRILSEEDMESCSQREKIIELKGGA